jgi:hypothetical protein
MRSNDQKTFDGLEVFQIQQAKWQETFEEKLIQNRSQMNLELVLIVDSLQSALSHELSMLARDIHSRLDANDLSMVHMGSQLKTIADKVQGVQNFQQLSAFNAHSYPMLFIVSEERITSMIDAVSQVVRQGFRIHFLCNVCGKLAPSGQNSSKENGFWTRLKILQDQGGYRVTALPDQLREISIEFGQELREIIEKGDYQTYRNYFHHRRFITTAHVKLVGKLFQLVNDLNAEYTGLRRCLHPLDGTCAWVCEENERSLMCPNDTRSCYELYQAEGRGCCLVDMEYV